MAIPLAHRRMATAVVLSLLPVACLDSTASSGVVLPTAPAPPPPEPQKPPQPLTAAPFPAVPNVSAIYDGPDGLYDFSILYHGASLLSRYVFFSDSTFMLQFSSARFGFFKYDGHYSRTDSLLTFTWNASSAAGPWGATATIRGDQLDVRYNEVMMMTDFVDGVYILVR